MNVCSSPSPDTGGSYPRPEAVCVQTWPSSVDRQRVTCVILAEHCTSDNRLREPRDRRGYLVFLGKLHRQECRTTAIGERGLDNIITLLDSYPYSRFVFLKRFLFTLQFVHQVSIRSEICDMSSRRSPNRQKLIHFLSSVLSPCNIFLHFQSN